MAADKLTSLPEDLLLDIVTKRLSGEAIRAFRCISKTWRSFIVKHFGLINHGRYMVPDHGTRFYLFVTWDSTQVSLYCFNGCSSSLVQPMKLNFSPDLSEYKKLIGYSNGLACIVRYNKPSYEIAPRYDIALWNPSINTIQIVSKFRCISDRVVLGFGFVPQTKDYKVVKLVKYYNQSDGYSVQVKVYSLISNSWKTISMTTEYTDYILANEHRTSSNTFVNGCAHWIAYRKTGEPVILCFNMLEEVFHGIDTPASIHDNSLLRVTRFGDTLALFWTIENYKFDVWVMKDYGVAESWSRLYKLTGIYFDNAYEIMDNGKILEIGYYGGHYFSYYDPVTKESIRLKL